MKNVLLLSLLFAGGTAFAQPLQTLYYKNGKKYIEGHWTFTKKNQSPVTLDLDVDAMQTQPSENAAFRQQKPGEEIPPMWADEMQYTKDPSQNLHIVPNGTFTMWHSRGPSYLQTTFKNGIQEGPFAEYYEPGKLLQKGTLKNGMPNGPWTHYYREGKPIYTGSYKAYSPAQLQDFWSKEDAELRAGVPQKYIATEDDWADAVANCKREGLDFPPYMLFVLSTQKDGRFSFFRRAGNPWVEVEFKDNVPVGNWKVWREKGKNPCFLIDWKAGVISAVTAVNDAGERRPVEIFSDAGIKQPEGIGVMEAPTPPPPPSVFTYVEKMPQFKGSINAWLAENLRYPPAAKEAFIEGRVVVKFIVQEDGSVTNATVEKGVRADLNAEALRLIKAMPAWEPGQQNGKPVKVYFRVPVRFHAE